MFKERRTAAKCIVFLSLLEPYVDTSGARLIGEKGELPWTANEAGAHRTPASFLFGRGAIMNFTNQDRSCVVTPPRSEGSLSMGREMLRCAQHDRTGFGR